MNPNSSRRDFFKLAGASTLALLSTSPISDEPRALPVPTAEKLPRWRGFNLLDKFIANSKGPNHGYLESDFEWISSWGFNFTRLPMSYRCWSSGDPSGWLAMDESQLRHIDEAVRFGGNHGVHVNLNLHRAPGYCVNPPDEPLNLWKDPQALDAAAHHWGELARRFRGTSNNRLSFDLLNEPADVPAATYIRVITRLVEAIRAQDPDRLIIADGLRWGRDPVPGLAALRIAQSTRGYDPMRVSHHQASWVRGASEWEAPTWPLVEGGKRWDKERLKRERIQPWKDLEKSGVGVHVGEWGVHNRTPHGVALAWMRDQLELWREAGWGWALWNFRGSFGILDSGRSDVAYEDFKGRKLDRKMLELLKQG